MNIFWKRDWGLKLLSAALAVILWVYVTNELNPTKEQEYKNLAVDMRGVKSNLAVSQLPGTVNIRVAANQSVLAELSPKSIEVFIDMQNVKAGINNVPVKVRVPVGVKVVDCRPPSVQVRLEQVAVKQVPVVIRTTETVADGYKVISTDTDPNQVIIRGPQSVLTKVQNAFVEVNLSGKSHSYSETIPVRIGGKDDENFDDEGLIKKEPQEVKVFTSIVPDLPTKTVKIIPKLTGNPAPGYTVTMTVVDPVALKIAGQQKSIAQIKEVYTMPVKIDGARQDFLAEVAPNLPSGVIAGRQLINVLVKVSKE